MVRLPVRMSAVPFLVAVLMVPGLAAAQPCPITGLYGTTLTPAAGGLQFSVVMADLNNDGLVDLLAATGGLTVMIATTPVSTEVEFLAPVTYATGGTPRDIVVEDFNGDGALDVAIACASATSGVYVFRGLKDGQGNPSGALGPGVLFNTGISWGLAAGDINGDGRLDLVVGAHGSGVITLFGLAPAQDGSIGFAIGPGYSSGGGTKGVALADFDGDGILDVAAANENDKVGILPGLSAGGQPTGEFGPPVILQATGKTYDVAVADLDGNGLPDIVSANYTANTVTVFTNRGSMTFTGLNYTAVGSPLGVALGDVNNDGLPDVVAAATGSGATFFVLEGLGTNASGDATFGSPVVYGIGNAYNIALGDLDGSGGPDVAGANYLAATMPVLLNTCQGSGEITLTVNVFGGGTVTVDPDLPVYPAGTEVTLTAFPGPHYMLAAWSGAATGSQNPITIVMDRPKSVTATFVLERYTLTLTTIGEGQGTVTRTPDQPDYAYGTTVDLEAMPALGSTLIGWGGDATGSDNPLSVLMDGPKSVTAEFQPDAEILPAILAIADVPLDQGGRVKIRWRASSWDRKSGDPLAFVKKYFVWREVPNAAVAAARAAEGAGLLRTSQADGDYYWEFVTSLPASAFPLYSYSAETSSDSTAAGNPYTRFLVQARNADDTEWWNSAPDSGYSVDNLAPPTPLPFVAVYGPSNTLHWTTSRAPDFLEFRLYRGLTETFVPGPQSFLTATRDTGYVDASGGQFYYKLLAVDVHGNPSGAALVSPDSPTAVLASLASLDTGPDHIGLRWYAPGHRGADAIVEKRTETRTWFALDTVTVDGGGFVSYTDRDVVEGEQYGYRIALFDAGEFIAAGETWASAVTRELAFVGAWPNPSPDGRLTIRFSLPDRRSARVELFDVSGRRVLVHEAGARGPGTHDLAVGGSEPLRAGIYLMRFTAGDLVRTQRVAVLR